MKLRTACLALLFLSGVSALAQQSPNENGSIPSTLAITYYCQPANRVPLRDYMVRIGLRQFEKWKSDGLFRGYRALFSSYLDTDTPSMMVLLDFSSPAAATRWMTIEHSMPGGLSHEGLSLVTSSQSAQMDHIFTEIHLLLPVMKSRYS